MSQAKTMTGILKYSTFQKQYQLFKVMMPRFKTNHDEKNKSFMSNGGLQLDQCLMHILDMLGFMWIERTNTVCSSMCN